MATRIVVGFDGSHGAEQALRWVLTTAATEDTKIEAVACWSLPVATVPPWVPAPFLDETSSVIAYQQQMAVAVEGVRRTVPGAPEVDLRVVDGVPGATLVDEAAGADLLVVGRRGAGGFVGLLLGSVADHCLQHATVPLALVPPEPVATTGAVVAGVDGSGHAGAALRWAADEAERLQRPLVALYAWDWLDQPRSFDPDFDGSAAERYAADVVASAIGERPAEVVAVNDLPARALMARSEAGDLVVVGSRGMGAVRGRLLGSVSRQLAHHAPGTVVVVRT